MLRFQVPEAMSGRDMDAVILELYVDAGAFGRRADLYENAGPGQPTAFVNNAPVLEVFSITGMREGDFSILSGVVGTGAVAKLHFYPSPTD